MYFGFSNYYNPGRVLYLIANILGGGVVPLVTLAIYVFTALSLYTIAQRRGLHCPWLAWIPVANLWLMGSLSDQYRYLTLGQVKHKRRRKSIGICRYEDFLWGFHNLGWRYL